MIFVRKASNSRYTDISNMYDIPTLYKKYGKFIIKESPWKTAMLRQLLVAGMFRLRKQNKSLIVISS